MKLILVIGTLAIALCALLFSGPLQETQAMAPVLVNTCTFTTVGNIMVLNADCTTDSSIIVPDDFTLDGNNNSVTAVDPSLGSFLGGVVVNAGPRASVVNLTITTMNLSVSCKSGHQRLRGIYFTGASGTIANNTVVNLNQGASGCQEGNAIEVRNCGDSPDISVVEISSNNVSNYQKTGIVANCDVDVNIHHNKVGSSATQANLAANGVQLGFGAKGRIEHNQVAGNSWQGPDAAATAILLFQSAPGSVVGQNNLMDGNADVGIYIEADGVIVENNRVFESGDDGYYDIGIGNYGAGNDVKNNKIRGYAIPLDGVTGGKNKAIPSPKD